MLLLCLLCFFHDPAPTEIYTLSLHDALPISEVQLKRCSEASAALEPEGGKGGKPSARRPVQPTQGDGRRRRLDRKSTRLNSSHLGISYAVFCLKKKKKKINHTEYKR